MFNNDIPIKYVDI